MKRNLLAILVLLSMCLGLSAQNYPSDARSKGTCGTCYWYVTSAGEFVIAPNNEVSGELADWGTQNVPWYNSQYSMKKAVIKPGVKAKTCRRMFYNNKYITSCDLSGLNTEDVTTMAQMFYGCAALESINLGNLNTGKVTDMSYMFYSCFKLKSLDLSNLNTSKVTAMDRMFSGCNALTSLNLSNLNTSNVTTMYQMFFDCRVMESVNVSSFNTEKVTNMSRMFYNCPVLKSLDLGNFNTANVTDMSDMFAGCSALESLNVSSFNTTNVTNMSDMFLGCGKLESLNLSNFNTSNVTNMLYMFSGCSALTSVDVSSFDTGKLMSLSYMFADCKALTSVDVSNFNTANVTTVTNMFKGCNSLKSLDLSSFNTDKLCYTDDFVTNCTALESINLTGFKEGEAYHPGTVTRFGNCINLTSIISNTATPSAIPDDFFYNLPTLSLNTCTLYVPAGSKALYEAADGWKNMPNIVEYNGDDDGDGNGNIANNGGNTGIWAALVDENGQQIDCTDYVLGVIIDDEPRASARGKATYVGNDAIYRFEVVVPGDDIDEGKEMKFALVSLDGKIKYAVTPSTSIKYNNEKTYGKPSQPITFRFVKPTSISASGEIHVNVGESVKLGQYLTVAPAGANIPYLEWQIVPTTQESISIDYESTDDIATGNAKLTGQFPTASPLRVRPYISGVEGITFSNTKYLRVYVDQPIESLELTEDYADGVITLYADQQTPLTLLGTQLRTILNGCYSVNPSTATETPVWTSGNEEIIANDGQGNWNILTTGECVMTLTAASGATVSVTVKIIRRVDGINVYDGTLHIVVGDDVSCFHQAYEVFPANATNKSVTIDVITNSQVFLIDPISNVALAPGEGKFKITSNDNPQYVSFVPFIIEPKYEINVPAQPLAFTTEDDDITDRVLDKVSITNRSARYAMWMSNNNNVVSINMNEEIPELMDITVNGEGSATITVSVNQHRTTITGPGINGLSNVEVPVSKTFVINVIKGLTGFQFDDILTEVGEWVYFNAAPVPADADYDYHKIEIYYVDDATGEVDFDREKASLWGGSNKQYVVVPNEPLKGKLVTYYNGVSLGEAGSANINAGQGITPAEGWDWISTYVRNTVDINSIYGDNLIEARSQNGLLYNDSEFGYFGSLTDFKKVVGYKVKSAADGERTIVPSDGSYDKNAETTFTLRSGYNWIGCPYANGVRYNDIFPLYDVFADNAQEGDMVISQDDGFAEYVDEYWEGSLEGIETGKGYIYYNAGPDKTITAPAETSMYEEGLAKALVKSKTSVDEVWQYNCRAFANNMPVIARIEGLSNGSEYTVGAFVGNECRGRGTFVNGKFFITVHGEKGESVRFMLHNTFTGEFIAVDGTLTLAGRAGSIAAPVVLSADMTATAISVAELNNTVEGMKYNLAGQRVADNAKGIIIMKGHKKVKIAK